MPAGIYRRALRLPRAFWLRGQPCKSFPVRGPPKCVLLLPTAMADFESLLTRWQTAGILDGATARHIRAWESEQKKPAGLRWQGLVVLILGAILLACGGVL